MVVRRRLTIELTLSFAFLTPGQLISFSLTFSGVIGKLEIRYSRVGRSVCFVDSVGEQEAFLQLQKGNTMQVESAPEKVSDR